MVRKYELLTMCLLSFTLPSKMGATDQFVVMQRQADYFPLAVNGKPAAILADENDYKGVLRAVEDLKEDFRKVTGNVPSSSGTTALIIGTAGKSAVIDRIIRDRKILSEEITGKREKYIIRTVEHPAEGISRALVIAGSDRRGTIYGIYELSSQIGVSPWYYWADVPVEKHPDLYVKPDVYTDGEPAVEYRGIFLNDEAPALKGWTTVAFGGFNHQFYEKIFELILRLKGNFLWPAMWGNAFYDDDPLNGPTADDYGIVIGTSHHEPLGRAHDEWRRYGQGPWDYTKNQKLLQEFWRQGMERMKTFEKVVTVGMRGDGDEPMSRESNIALLQRIVKDQRSIIAKVTGKKTEATPQVWALYKEVQDYYDKGMRVPDDITLMLCDDNWGNVRKLPELTAKPRKGGYGMYYHFDYVGGPRNYKWINVSQIQRVWEQMNLTYRYDVNKIWIVNVGDLKPMEYPISFFLDMAWNPDRFNPGNLLQHTEEWCARQFGEPFAKESARLINLYTKYNRRVTPELLNDQTYSLTNYNEFEKVVSDYKDLLTDAMRLYNTMPAQYKDAFDELVLFPINACSNLYDMYYAVARNRYYAQEGNPIAAKWADKVEECFQRDSLLTLHYNQNIAGGKWAHMMDQVRIGYRWWQDPPTSIMPAVVRPEANPLPAPEGYAGRLFRETDGYVSIEAEHYSRKKEAGNIVWKVIPDLGKTLSAVTTFPVTATPAATDDVSLEYDVDLKQAGEVRLIALLSPTLNFNANKGLRYGISINGEEEQIVNFNQTYTEREREQWVANSIIESVTKHHIPHKGICTIRFRILDPGIVLQKIMMDTGGLKPSYLGAPESPYTEYNK
jgi:hypothetical protein